ncbi:hypothetical protein [Planctomicrobium sp. SH664]|uniref:hypothetical protein n=1 Tax=Planctomicrobium sp. SH664 TaxID=3448125 RepID=UPI003F5C37EB
MRGPGIRLKLDIRRLWRCPVCHYERKAPANEVAVRCHCTKEGTSMKLVEGQRKVRLPSSPIDMYMHYDDLMQDDGPPHHDHAEEQAAGLAPAVPPSQAVRDELNELPPESGST